MKHKLKEWLRRYLPPFLIATIATLFFSNLGRFIELNSVLTAYLGAWGGIISYYSYIAIREVLYEHKKKKISFSAFLKIFRNLVFEFSPAEALDILLIGPFCLYIFPKIITNFQIAILLGKFCADIFFYSTTITFYEIRKKLWH